MDSPLLTNSNYFLFNCPQFCPLGNCLPSLTRVFHELSLKQANIANFMFLHLSVILLTGGRLPQCMLGYKPLPLVRHWGVSASVHAGWTPGQTPPLGRHPPGQTPPGQTTPLSRHPPTPGQTPSEMNQTNEICNLEMLSYYVHQNIISYLPKLYVASKDGNCKYIKS